MHYLLTNANLILPDVVISGGWVAVEDGVICAIGGPDDRLPHAAQHFDVDGKFLLPGIVDLHCDMIEKMTQPRPGVEIAPGIALHATDRLLLGCGVTSELHSLSLDDDEFGPRSDRFVSDFLAHLSRERHCGARHLLHARVEVSSERGVPALRALIDSPLLRLISIMDHSPGQGQYTSEAAFRTYVARSSGRGDTEIDAILERKRALQHDTPTRIAQVIALAAAHGIPLASHDDDTPAKVAEWASRGVDISEFPTTLAAAKAAHQAGMAVGMGAPNLLRGRSSSGNLSALTAIEAGVVDWLCADYYPAALLPAAFMLAERGILSLPAAVALITRNPAHAIGMGQQIGSIAVGLSADLLLVEPTPDPVVRQVFVAGRPVLTLNY